MRAWVASIALLSGLAVSGQVTEELDGTAHSHALCYHDGMDSTITYVDSTDLGAPIVILFCAGQMEACCDRVYIFDGTDALAPLLFEGNGNSDMTGMLAFSTNTGSALTLRIESNGSISCQDQGYVPLQWVVFPMSLGEQDCVFAGMQEHGRATPLLRPTVATDRLIITLPADEQHASISIVDADGRSCVVTAVSGPQAVIPVSSLSPGSYVLLYEGATGRRSAHRFVIAR